MNDAQTRFGRVRNAGCTPRAVLDVAGVDNEFVAAQAMLPPGFGQTQFVVSPGNALGAEVRANGCAELLSDGRSLPSAEVRCP